MDIELEIEGPYSFYENLSPEQLEASARFWEFGIFDKEDPRGLSAAAYTWQFCAELDLSLINEANFDWAAWFEEERQIWAEDGDPTRYDALLHDDRIKEAIIVVMHEGRAWVWDGHHRTGASVAAGRSSIPAIVGRLG